MKTTNSKLIFFAAAVAVIVVATGMYLSLGGVPANSGSVLPPESGVEPPKTPLSPEPPETIVKNDYPVPAQKTVYGSLQRVGSSKNDEIKKSYFIGGYIYLIFYAEKNDYDSGENGSVNIAKLNKNGAVIKTALLGKGKYLSSKPVWSGIAVCIFDGEASNVLVFTDFELEISALRSLFPAETYLYFYDDRLFCVAAANGILSLTAFGEDLAPSPAAIAAAPQACSVTAVFGSFELQIVLSADSAFYVYAYNETFSPTAYTQATYSASRTAGLSSSVYTPTGYSASRNVGTLSKIAEVLGNADTVLPHKDGYIIIGKNSGVIRLYNANFVKTDEKTLGGFITGIEKTAFGYAATSKTDGGSEVFFLCPHFDTLLTRSSPENLAVKNAGGSPYFYSVSDGYLNLYKLSDFEIVGFLTVAAAAPSPPDMTGDGKSLIITLNAKRVSSLNSYGENDVFAVIYS
jgi:hypothetical protein